MGKFTFGKYSYSLTFIIDDGNIFLCPLKHKKLDDEKEYFLSHHSYIADVHIVGRNHYSNRGSRNIFSSEAFTLKYVKHFIEESTEINKLIIIQKNDICEVTSIYEEYVNSGVLRSHTEVKNISHEPFVLEYVSSFTSYPFTSFNSYDKCDLYTFYNTWYLEAQVNKSTLSDLGIYSLKADKTFRKFLVSNKGNWSTKEYLPLGILHDKKQKAYMMWQIEHNGSWSYELGDFSASTSLSLNGPSYNESGWKKELKPNEIFVSVNASLTKGDSLEDVINHFNRYRRFLMKDILKNNHDEIIFNEYMFTSWISPNEETIKRLAPLAKEYGASIYVIDCGWHENKDPFNSFGRWDEAIERYPHGLNESLDYIRSLGMKIGLWFEPEMIGIYSSLASELPDDYFIKNNGKRIVMNMRYHLNLVNNDCFDYLLNKVSGVINKYHLDYVKFDYNADVMRGDDNSGFNEEDGLLNYDRAYLKFLEELRKRHPSLIIESCASGGNRLDQQTLLRSDVYSISDNEYYDHYPYIIPNLFTAILPEQSLIWCYPNNNLSRKNTLESTYMNMINVMLGRICLTSYIDELDKDKQQIVKKGISLYNEYNGFRKDSDLILPLGFAHQKNKVIAFGLKKDNKSLICLYNYKQNKEIIILDIKGIKQAKIVFTSSNNAFLDINIHQLTIHGLKPQESALLELIY